MDVATSSVRKGEDSPRHGHDPRTPCGPTRSSCGIAARSGAVNLLSHEGQLQRHQRWRRPARASDAGRCSTRSTWSDDRRGSLEGLLVAICGDIMHSRVARSNIHLLQIMAGAGCGVVGPLLTLMPTDVDQMGVEVHYNIAAPALKDVDIVKDSCGCRPSACRARLRAVDQLKVFPLLRPRPREAEVRQARRADHASRPDQSRRRNRLLKSPTTSTAASSTSRSRWASPCAWPASEGADRRPPQCHRSRGGMRALGMSCWERRLQSRLAVECAIRRRAVWRAALQQRALQKIRATRGNILRGAAAHAGSTAYINARIVRSDRGRRIHRRHPRSATARSPTFGPNLFASGAPYESKSVACRGLYLAPGLVDARRPYRPSRARSFRKRWRAPASPPPGGRHHVDGACCPTTSRRSTTPR